MERACVWKVKVVKARYGPQRLGICKQRVRRSVGGTPRDKGGLCGGRV